MSPLFIIKRLRERPEMTESGEIFGTFFLNSNEFALTVSRIQEVVYPPEALTHIPLSPTYLLGFLNLRGRIIPVVNLKIILGLESDDQPMNTKKIVIVEHNGIHIRLLCNRTGELFKNQAGAKCDFSYSETPSQQIVISGAIKLDSGKRLVQILDIFALLKLEKLPHVASDATTSAADA